MLKTFLNKSPDTVCACACRCNAACMPNNNNTP